MTTFPCPRQVSSTHDQLRSITETRNTEPGQKIWRVELSSDISAEPRWGKENCTTMIINLSTIGLELPNSPHYRGQLVNGINQALGIEIEFQDHRSPCFDALSSKSISIFQMRPQWKLHYSRWVIQSKIMLLPLKLKIDPGNYQQTHFNMRSPKMSSVSSKDRPIILVCISNNWV